MDEDCLRISRIDVEDMKHRDWVELQILKCKHENFPIQEAINLIYHYVNLDLNQRT